MFQDPSIQAASLQPFHSSTIPIAVLLLPDYVPQGNLKPAPLLPLG